MSITLLFGVGEVGKREQLLKLKSSSTQAVVTYDLAYDSQITVGQVVMSQGLFSPSSLVVVENAPTTLDLEKLKIGKSVDLVVVADSLQPNSPLLKSTQKLKGRIIHFEAEKETRAFLYLDSLIEGKKEAFYQLDKLLKNYSAMYVITMVYYLLRRNLLPPTQGPFLKQKIQRQKLRVSSEQWEKLYCLTLETEFKIKKGMAVSEELALYQLTQKFLAR